ncbi:hypothetical protein BGZ95_009798 [Linnemannia exigua]|uniref:HMG box domain-containing protein n=1 Tax=Linnemannia exigua TaxID=604196 RepID=A0AAD4DCR2_9FUNG|nr:hypothetical protein BGZ95_009798 [Linnemannia exigua]
MSSDASDSGLDSYLSSSTTNILPSSIPSAQSTISKEQTQKPPSDVSKSKVSSTPKRPTASGSSSPRPLQFINKSGPPAPRPKPQLPMGVYVQTHSAMQQKARKQIREEGKVKRTSNCFIKYRTYVHPIIVARFGNQNNKEISRLAGRWWKNEPEEVKSLYRQQAAEEKERHATLYPSYKYTPAKPAPKGGCSSNSAKSKPQCPWNKPTRLSSPPAQLDDSPVSPVSLSPLPIHHDTEGKNGTGVQPVEGELAEDSSPPQSVAPDKPSASAADSLSPTKSSKERSFVVTETALFDFTGNANLNEKRCSSKSRSHQRLPGMTDLLPLEISLANTTGTSIPSPSNPFTFVLQGPAVANAPFPAGPKGVSGLTQALAQQRSDSPATPSTLIPIVPRAPASDTTPGWITMASRHHTPGISPQRRWHVPKSSPQQACLAAPVLTTLTAQPLNAVFQNHIGVSAGDIGDIATNQNWVQSLPPSPQPPPPFLPHLATNLVQVPQSSTPIQIPVPSVVTSQFSQPFSSHMYTPVTPLALGTGARSTPGADSGFPWQLNASFDNTPAFGLLYSPQPCEPISGTPAVLPSTPLMTMHIQQQGVMPSSSMHTHPALDPPHQVLVASFEDELVSVSLEHEMSSSPVSDKMLDGTTWNAKVPSSMPPTTTSAWEYPLLITNQGIELKQQLLFSDSSSNSSSLSTTPGSVYPDIDMSTWTTLEEPQTPSPVFISDNNSANNTSDDSGDISNISDVNVNDHTVGVDATSTSSSSDDDQVITLASQPTAVPLPVSSNGQASLAWDNEEQLKMSINYYEEIVQQQKMLLNLQRQWRQQAQAGQSSTASMPAPLL